MVEVQHLEAGIIILTGLLFHLIGISLVEFSVSNDPGLKSSIPSFIFTLSILCILNQLRPIRSKSDYGLKRFVLFLLEMIIILFATDFFLHELWIPGVRLLYLACKAMNQQLLGDLHEHHPGLAKFIRHKGFFFARLFMSSVVFLIMLDTTGIFVWAKECLISKKNDRKKQSPVKSRVKVTHKTKRAKKQKKSSQKQKQLKSEALIKTEGTMICDNTPATTHTDVVEETKIRKHKNPSVVIKRKVLQNKQMNASSADVDSQESSQRNKASQTVVKRLRHRHLKNKSMGLNEKSGVTLRDSIDDTAECFC